MDENETVVETSTEAQVAGVETQVVPPVAPEAKVDVVSREKFNKVESEAKNLRNRLREFEEAEDARKRAAMSEQERLQADATSAKELAAKLERELREERALRTIERAAAERDLDVALASTLIRVDQIEFDADTGTPTNVTSLLDGFLEKWPNLKKTAAPAAPAPKITIAPTNPDTTGSRAELTMDDIKKMSQTEINARWAEVSLVLDAQRRK